MKLRGRKIQIYEYGYAESENNDCTYRYYAIHDPCHGPKEDRYTIIMVPRAYGTPEVKVIGRELPLKYARELIADRIVKNKEQFLKALDGFFDFDKDAILDKE